MPKHLCLKLKGLNFSGYVLGGDLGVEGPHADTCALTLGGVELFGERGDARRSQFGLCVTSVVSFSKQSHIDIKMPDRRFRR